MGTDYAVVGYVYRGERYTILDEKTAANGREWYLISVDGVNGWISAGVAEVESITGYPSGDAWEGNADRYCTIIAQSARARSGAGTDYEVIAYVYRGERYAILDTKTASNGKTWYLVCIDGVNGWISSGVTEAD